MHVEPPGGAVVRTQRTFCRICEAHCGIEVDVDDREQVVAVRPDRDHPVSRGYACVKGTSLGGLHHDPARIDHPYRREGDRWRRISWRQALDEIGERVRALRAAHGDRSIALYTGNPTFFSFANIVWSQAFLEALGSPNHFASHSIDVNTKFKVATEVYGLPTVHPVPDLARTSFALLLGTNPAVTQLSVVQAPDALGRLRDVERRGGRVVVVDPRRTETAQRVGEHLAIRPGTDAYLLAGMLHVLAHSDAGARLHLDVARAHADGVDAAVAAVASWTPDRVAEVTGIDAATIVALARDWAAADGACLYLSTGVNMGPFGSIAYWLVQALLLLSGNLDRPGGHLVPEGPFDVLRLARVAGPGASSDDRTLVSGWSKVAGAFPVGALVEEIRAEHPERIRALIVSAGNPVHSVPGGEVADALDELDLVVCIDLYANETAAHADYLLPATDMLERSDYPVAWANLQLEEHAQFTEPVVRPVGDRRPEWEIFSDLAVACGAPALGSTVCNALPRLNRVLDQLPGARRVTPDTVLGLLLRWGGKTTLGELRATPEGVLLPPTEPGSFLGRRVPTPDRRMRLDPPDVLADLDRLDAEAAALARPPEGTLALIGRRQRRSHNSWMHSNPDIRQPDGNQALVHPDDAAARGIADGDVVEVAGPGGTIRLPARITDEVAVGVVCIPHGWGHGGSGSERAAGLAGANPNLVMGGGSAWCEPVSGQSRMLAQRVTVAPVGGDVEPSVAPAPGSAG